MKFVLQPICSEKKSNWMSASFSVVNLTENFDVIGYFPKLTATRLTKFLKRPSNSEKVIIKGKRVNRGGGGGGYGLEVPCEYYFQGDNFLCNWFKQKLMKEEFDLQPADQTRLTSN